MIFPELGFAKTSGEDKAPIATRKNTARSRNVNFFIDNFDF
jgi:hypothetical protein